MMGFDFGEPVLWRRKAAREQLGQSLGAAGQRSVPRGQGVDRRDYHRQRGRGVEDEDGTEEAEEMRWNPEEIEQHNGVPWDRRSEKAEDDVVRPRGHRESAQGDPTGGEAGRRGGTEHAEVVQHEARGLREARVHDEGVSGVLRCFSQAHQGRNTQMQCRIRMKKDLRRGAEKSSWGRSWIVQGIEKTSP